MNDIAGRDIVPAEGKMNLAEIKLAPGGGIAIGDVGQMLDMAKTMAKADIAVRKHLRGNPGACLGVLMQALDWKMQPFLVANKSYLVNDQLAYEAQMIHAVVLKHAPIKGRPKSEYRGEGPERTLRIWAHLRDEPDEIVEYTTPKVRDIKPKNSPLWVNDPDQQLHYFAIRAWCRRHFPDVIMGVYAPDELQGAYRGEMEGFNPLAAPQDSNTIDYNLDTGEVTATPQSEAAAIAAEAPKRKRATKAQMEARRAAEQEDAAEAGQEDAAEAEPLEGEDVAQETTQLSLLDGLAAALEQAATIKAWESVVASYKPVYDDLLTADPEQAKEIRALVNARRAAILGTPAQEPQEAQAEESATQVAEEQETATSAPETEQDAAMQPWPEEIEASVAKWDALPDVRAMCIHLWGAKSAEEAEGRYQEIASRRSAITDASARLAVRTMLGTVRRKFGEPS